MSRLNVPVQRPQPPQSLEVRVHTARELPARLPHFEAFVAGGGQVPLSRHPAWLTVLQPGLGHTPYCLEAGADGRTRGILPLAFLRSLLFGRFLVSLPYLNYGGPVAADDRAAAALIDRAVGLADELGVRHLELRNEWAVEHPSLGKRQCNKVHMRLELTDTAGKLWDQFDPRVRNQVRKGQRSGLTVAWGGEELLPEFYGVFSRNMRDLGTPVYGAGLFRAALRQFPGRAELCVVRSGAEAAAAALLLHGWEVTEVPSASCLRRFNPVCANMFLYWQLLERAAQRRQAVFDFGRSGEDSNTYRFKKQWGARPTPAEWQFYLRRGAAGDLRPDNPKYQRMIRVWQRLPVCVTRWLGPAIVRGIP